MLLDRTALFRLRLPSGLMAVAICLVVQGCASSPKKEEPDSAPTPSAASFQADVTADAVPGSAEIIPEMMTPTPKRAPGKAKAIAKAAATAKGKVPAAANGKSSPTPQLSQAAPHGKASAHRGPRGGATHYVVKANDTLMKISFKLLGDVYRWKEIYFENKAKIPDYNRLVKGTSLVVHPTPGLVIERNGLPHLILPRESLWSISDGVYGTPWKWRRLWENNRQLIHNPDLIYAYFSLYYLMTPKDEEEVHRLKLGRNTAPRPVAGVNEAPARAPASGAGH